MTPSSLPVRKVRVRRAFSPAMLAEARQRVELKLPVSLSHFAAFLGVSRRTVQNWVSQGKFRSVVYLSCTNALLEPDVYQEFLSHRKVTHS